MPTSWRRFLLGLAVLLGAGVAVGWLYDRVTLGLLIASLAALSWQVFRLFSFERAVRTDDARAFQYGDGIWQQIFARYKYANEQAARRKEQNRALLREIRKSTNAMPDGAVILNADNEIQVCNRAAKRLAGLKRRKDRGQRVDNILRHPEFTALLHSGDLSRSVEIPSPVDPARWLNCRVVPYGADQKMLLMRDVTDRIRVNKMRRDFVANASHELRSPLTVIAGYLDSFDNDEIPEALRLPIEQMKLQADRMRNIVSELLELSRLESAGPAQSDTFVDVAALLEKAMAAHLGSHDNVDIEVDIRSAARIRGSASQIESVITNLLTNALRHAGSGGHVSLAWATDKDGGVLSVADNGEGIPEDVIPRLTERFFRVDRGRSREDGGVGLGLAIVKHVLSRHDAYLSVDSTLGKGSTFRCHFPPRRVAERPAMASAGGAH